MAACRDALEEHLRLACQAADHTQALVSLSLALGAVEVALTSKTACQAPLKPEQLQARHNLSPWATLRSASRVAVAARDCSPAASSAAWARAGRSGHRHTAVPWLRGGARFQARPCIRRAGKLLFPSHDPRG